MLAETAGVLSVFEEDHLEQVERLAKWTRFLMFDACKSGQTMIAFENRQILKVWAAKRFEPLTTCVDGIE